jgi:acetaldehyde dehydrogenase
MRDTVLVLVHDPGGERQAAIRESVDHMVAEVAAYVPGYRLKHELQVSEVRREDPLHTLAGTHAVTHQVTAFLEVEGAAHYLPAYAGNLDIMTSSALRVAESVAERLAGMPRRVHRGNGRGEAVSA